MKITTFNKYISAIGIFIITFFFTSSVVLANNVPIVTTTAASSITQTSARLYGTYFANNAVTHRNRPATYFRYGTDANNLDMSTASYKRYTSSANFSLVVRDLEPNTTYYYQIMMSFEGDVHEGGIVSFTTKSNEPAPVIEETVPIASNSSNSSNTSSVSNEPSVSNGSSSSNNSNTSNTSNGPSGSSASNNASNASSASNGSSASGSSLTLASNTDLALSITNNTGIISRGDVVAYDINARNTQSQTMNDLVVFVNIPEDMSIFRITGYDNVNQDGNTLIINGGTLAAGEEISVRIMAELKRTPSQTDAVARAQALYTYNNNQGTASAFDIDEYATSNVRGGGAALSASAGSAGSAGPSPLGIIGWLIILIMIAAIVFGIRVFLKKKNERADEMEFFQDEDGNIKPMRA